MFEITGAGVIMAVAGIACLLIVGRWLLPDRQVLSGILPRSQDRHFMADVLVPLGSPLVGKRLGDAGFTEARGLRVVDLVRRDRSLSRELHERSEEHPSELQSLMRTSYAAFCLKKKQKKHEQ